MGASWLLWAILATIGWGGAYVFLKPAGPVAPLVIQVLCGGGSMVLNLLAMGIWALATVDPSKTFLDPWRSMARNPSSLYLIGYVSATAFGGFAYLTAASMPEVPLSVLTALTAAYPLVTTTFMFAIFREFDKINLWFAIPGMILTSVGCVLLALSVKPTS
jgi:drug/metabolite transporter (DMT)-like permease